MTATPTAAEVHAALAALPGAYRDPHPSRFDSEALALTVTGTDSSMVETWVPVHVAAAGHGIDGYVSLTVFVIYAETPDNQGGWMCSSCKVGFPGLSTAVEIAASVQQMAELAAGNVNTAARLARDGKLAEALEYAGRKRIKWEPVGMNLAELEESLAAA